MIPIFSQLALEPPLDQFKVKTLIGEAGSATAFTNSSLMMIIAVLISVTFLYIGIKKQSVIPGRLQSMTEIIYGFILSTLKDNIGKKGRSFFPLVFTLFIFILFCNLLGMMPYSFTVTSHIVVTFALALLVIITVFIAGLIKQGTHFFSIFVPKGVPGYIMPLIVLIEVISFLSRPISLSIRLAANMTAGHVLIKVLASFTFYLKIFGILPIISITLITGFEIFIAILHAYIFTLLTCIYLNDAVEGH